jgi:hypothetical protein
MRTHSIMFRGCDPHKRTKEAMAPLEEQFRVYKATRKHQLTGQRKVDWLDRHVHPLPRVHEPNCRAVGAGPAGKVATFARANVELTQIRARRL